MLELLLAVIVIALVAYVVSLMLGQPAGLIAFVVLLIIIVLYSLSSNQVHLH